MRKFGTDFYLMDLSVFQKVQVILVGKSVNN
jgi:hypothetical protein